MADNFDTSLRLVLADEGGNSDDPNDHGGRTSRGITQREYDHWCGLNNKQGGDVWNASDEDIAAIYKDQYWNPYCSDLPTGLDYLFFDISVNCGRTQAVRQFQRGLGVNVDGMMGIVTKNSIHQQAREYADTIKYITYVLLAIGVASFGYSMYGLWKQNKVQQAI
jgi:lysozyme family protein